MSEKLIKTLFLLMAISLLAIFLTRTTNFAITEPGLTVSPKTAGTATSQERLYLPLITRPIATLAEQISVTIINLPVPLADMAGSWCTWGGCVIGPRLYHTPLPDGSTLIGWTDQQGNGHVTHHTTNVTNDWLFPNQEIRGLVTHADDRFAVILWQANNQTLWLSQRLADGSEDWTTNLNSTIARADFWLGDGRLEYGNGLYAAYFTVKGVAGGFEGHHGDQLTYVNDAGVIQPDGWNWGCSHSMAQLVTYHPELDQFAAVCSSDCFPDKSIHWVNASHQIFQADGNCGGLVSAQLGQMAVGNDTWMLVFNAQARPCCTGKGIALATLTGNQQSSLVWLTNTTGQTERDPAIARIGTGGMAERYLIGWLTINDNSYWLGVVDESGYFWHGPDNVTPAGIGWGNRDESFRTGADGRISWVQGDAGSSQIRLFQFDGGPFLP